jgi:RNA polymerase sigma factor (sigma-70 family)
LWLDVYQVSNLLGIFAISIKSTYLMNTELKTKDDKAGQLLLEYRNGNTAAFTPIYNMYVNMLFNYGHCLTSNTELIKDCVHDVFVKLLNPNSKLNVKSISSYLIISLRNRLVDEFRHANHTIENSVEDIRVNSYDEGVEARYLITEHTRLVHEKVNGLLETLTPRQRKVFQLYYIEQRKYDEICEIMNMNYHSVRNLVHRGMVRLREQTA